MSVVAGNEAQWQEMETVIKGFIPEKKPIDPEMTIREALSTRTKEAATTAQADILKMIARFGKDLVQLRDSGVDAKVYNLTLKDSGYGSNWGLKLVTEQQEDGVGQVVVLSEDKGSNRTEYTRYAQTNAEAFLSSGRDLTDEARQEILEQTAPDGTILVQLNKDGKPEQAFSNVTHTFVSEIAHKTFYDVRQVVDYQSGDQYKKYTDHDKLHADLTEVASRFSSPLEEMVPTALAHLKQSANPGK